MFPKNADPAKVKAHHDHIHAHFDLTLAGLNLERWVVIFVIFGLFQLWKANRLYDKLRAKKTA